MRLSATDALVEELTKIANSFLHRRVGTVIDRAEVPIVGGLPVRVGAFGDEKQGSDPACEASHSAHHRDPEQHSADTHYG